MQHAASHPRNRMAFPKPILFTKPDCTHSARLKELLALRGIPYEEYNIYSLDVEDEVHHTFFGLGGTPTPQVKLGHTLIYDYDEEESLAGLIETYVAQHIKK